MKTVMKNTELSTIAHQPSTKRRMGLTGRRTYAGRSVKTILSRKVSKKVHSNINFSELDEVCRDVGKVDLSLSAKMRSDSCISPQKDFEDHSSDFHTISFEGVNGHILASYDICNNNQIEGEMNSITSCYVHLEPLNNQQLLSLDRMTESSGESDSDNQEWKGWQSSISFSEQHSCPLVKIKEGSKVSEVLVMSDGLIEGEFKMLQTSNDGIFNMGKFETRVLGSPLNKCDSTIKEKKLLKEKLSEYFADIDELLCFIESVDVSYRTAQMGNYENKLHCRKLNFGVQNQNVSTSSKIKEITFNQKKAKAGVNVGLHNDDLGAPVFLGFTESTISSSKRYAEKILEFYQKVKIRN